MILVNWLRSFTIDGNTLPERIVHPGHPLHGATIVRRTGIPVTHRNSPSVGGGSPTDTRAGEAKRPCLPGEGSAA